jgi:TonB family protein
MRISSLLRWLSHFPIPFLSIVMLIATACSTPVSHREIHDAARAGDLARVKALLQENRNLVLSQDSNGFTPLPWAAWHGHKDVVALLLAKDAEVNFKTSDGFTPLHFAVRNGNKGLVELLLANKAEVNAKTNGGLTPLHFAALNGCKDAAALLLAHKVVVNSRSQDDRTPLHWAAENGHKDVAALLLAKDAEIDAKDKYGVTPLQLAMQNNHKDVVELLLANKAEVRSGSQDGNTFLHDEAISGDNDLAKLPRRRGGGDDKRPYTIEQLQKYPVMLVNPLPPYTEEARKMRIEGMVVLQATIRKNGRVDSFKVAKGLGYGLDESAINTIATKWRFKPGILNGYPVDVTANIEVRFRLF